MLGPKQFDQVNRDLEIRDLYNMEDAFELGESYQGAYRARLNANLAFWDGLDGAVDWPVDGDGAHPLTELLLADYLVVDVTKPYVEQGSFLEPEMAALRGAEHETCGGRTLNDDVMDRLFTLVVNAGNGPDHPRRRRRVDAAVVAGLPLPGRAEPGPAEAPTAARALSGTAVTTIQRRRRRPWSWTTSRAARCTSAPRPTSGRTSCCASTIRAAGRALVRRLIPLVETGRPSDEPAHGAWLTVAFTYHGPARRWACRRRRSTASRRSSGRAWPRAPPSSATSARAAPAHWETAARHAGRPRRPGASSRRTRSTSRRSLERARRAQRGASRRRGDLAAGLLPAADGPDVVRLQGRHRPAGHRGQRHPAARTRTSRRSRRASSSSATPTRPASCRRCPRRTCSAATAPTSSSASCTRAWRRTGSTCARRPRAARTRRCSRPRWSAAGRAARRSRWRRSATIRSSAPTRGATTTSAYGDDLRGFKCPAGAHARRANPRDALDLEGSVDARLHRMIRRGTSYGPMLPDGRARGRRRRPRDRVRLRRRAHQAAVRVRQDPVAERRHLHRRPGRARPARRAQRRRRAASPSRSGRSAGA